MSDESVVDRTVNVGTSHDHSFDHNPGRVEVGPGGSSLAEVDVDIGRDRVGAGFRGIDDRPKQAGEQLRTALARWAKDSPEMARTYRATPS